MSTESMSEQLQRLKRNLDRFTAVAKAATPGPWGYGRTSDRHGARFYVTPKAEGWVIEPVGHMEPEDAEYIATFDPPTVLGLLATVAQVEKVIEQAAKLEATLAEHRRRVEALERRR